ncbi:MAG TPA: hypothetical protein VIL48_13640 [Acidimicrobiales bacterium]
MALSRRRKRKDPAERDPFGHLAEERRAAESGEPWFLAPDDGPELDVEAGISSNLRDEDLD